MKSSAKTVEEYLQNLPADRCETIGTIREVILANLPRGYEECISCGMIGYVVPHSVYPAGYHCDPKQPLPFANIASQKNYISFYHMGLYSNSSLLKWFTAEYPKHTTAKLDMGKCCVRFKKPEHIPYKLIGDLVKKISAKDWKKNYEEALKR